MNGTGLFGRSAGLPALLVKKPQSSSQYYIITQDNYGSACNSGKDLRYTIVDASLAAGHGSVILKNQVLYSVPRCVTSDNMTLAQHCNGTDFWLITMEIDSSMLLAYHISGTGINPVPVKSKISAGLYNVSIGREIAISPNGKKVAFTINGSFSSTAAATSIGVSDFDNSTGSIGTPLLLYGDYRGFGGSEFSPDGTKLYATAGFCYDVIFQWDLCGSDPIAINATKTDLKLTLSTTNPQCIRTGQIAPDGRLYFCRSTHPASLAAVANPNLAGSACSVIPQAISLTPFSAGALPNMPNYNLRNIDARFSASIACRNVSFQAPAHLQSQCAFTQYTPNAVLWNFGDTGSAATNTSTSLNPTHVYSAVGNYSTTLVINYDCYSDTFKQVVSITQLGPSIVASGNFTICPGQKSVITLAGNYNFHWSNNMTGATVTLTPSQSLYYHVTATDSAGCTASDWIGVTVSNCLSLDDGRTIDGISIYPNPASDRLFVITEQPCLVNILDALGRSLHIEHCSSGDNSITLSRFPAGVYSVMIATCADVFVKKIVIE